jgi:WD40 repeat protein
MMMPVLSSRQCVAAICAVACLSFLLARARAAESLTPIPIADVHRTTPVDFSSEILPILQKNCLTCHNAKDPENGLSLETPEGFRKGGAEGPVVVPGKADESRLLRLAAHLEEPLMPPADNKVGAAALTPEHLGLLKLWIDQGAKGDAAAIPRIVKRHALPRGLHPIHALAITTDDEYVACSRGTRLFVYHLPGMRLAAELTDPSLADGRAAHEDVIRSLAFARSGDLLASGGFRTVKLWRRPRSQIARETGSALPITALAVSPDGQILARGTSTGAIELLSPGDDRPARTLVGHEGAVVGVALAHDGSRLYSVGTDKTLRAWDFEAAKELGKIILPAEVRGLALLHGGNQLATAHADQMVRLWDAAAILQQPAGGNPPSPVREFKGHSKPVTCVATVPSVADRLLSGGEDGRLRLWNTASGETLREFDHGGAIAAIAARPDGLRFASVGANGALRLWKADDGAMIVDAKSDPRASQSLSRAETGLNYAKACVEYRKQEHREADEQLKRETSTVEGANKAKEQAEKMLSEKTASAQKAIAARTAADEAAKPAAEALAAATQARATAQAAVEEAEKSVVQATTDFNRAREAAAKDNQNDDLAAARDAAEKALGETKQKKQAADAALQKASQALREAQQKSETAIRAARQAADQAKQPERQLEEAKSAWQGAVNFIVTANAVLDRARAAVPAAQQKVADAEVLVARREMEKKGLADAAQVPLKALKAVAFSLDSCFLATAGEDGTLWLYDAEKGSPLETLPTPIPTIEALAFADGRLFAGGAAGPTLDITPAGPWTLERTIGRADDPDQLVDRVLSLDFSPDGNLLATGSGLPARSGQLKFWNVSDGSLAREIAAAHRDTIYGLRFSPDGQHLASAAADRLAKVFRVADGSLVKSLEGHTHHALGIAWSADGRLLATSGGDQVVKLWDFERGAVLRTMRGDAYRIGRYKREVTSIAFIGGTEHLVTSSGDGTVRMHRTSSDRDIRAFKEGAGFLHAAVASSDGKLILGGGRDGVLHVWNGETGYKVSELKPE